MKLKPHRSYTKSKVAWIGEIPEHWKLQPGRAVFYEKKTKNTGMIESQVLSLSYGHIVIKPPEKLHGLVPESFETYQIVDPGDIIVRSTDLQNDWNSLRIGLVKNRGIITSAYLCLNVNDLISSEYAHLLLHAYDLKKIYYGMGTGLRQNLSFSDFKYLPVLIPPLSEQTAIVRFLNFIERRITHFIRAKRETIALLEEQEKTMIQHAVTRGLDPDAPLKSSQLDWLGDIPEHWEERRAKYYLREVDERSKTGEEELLSVSHITSVTPRSQKNITMFKAESYVGHKLCRPGDLVVNTMWAWMGALGIAKQSGIVSPSYAVYRPIKEKNFVPAFADNLLRAQPYVSEYICCSTGIRSSRLRLYPDKFLSIPILRPPYNEQMQIVEFITEQTKQLENAIEKNRREINLLREYHARLIADVVTGKLDVREAVGNLSRQEGNDAFDPSPNSLESIDYTDLEEVIADDAH